MGKKQINKEALELILSDHDKKEVEALLENELLKGNEMNTELVEALTSFLSKNFEEAPKKGRVEYLSDAQKIINKQNKAHYSKIKIAAFASCAAAVIIFSFILFPKDSKSTAASLKSMLFGDTAVLNNAEYTKKNKENKAVKPEKSNSQEVKSPTEAIKETETSTTQMVIDETYYDIFNNAKQHFTSLVCDDKEIAFSSFEEIDYGKITISGVYYNTILEKECYYEIPNELCEFSLIYNDEELGRATINVTFEDLSQTIRVFYKTENSPTLSSVYVDDKGQTFTPENATVYAIYSDNTKKRIPSGEYSFSHSEEEKDGYIYNFYYITYIESDVSVSTTLTYKTAKGTITEAIK